MSLKTRLIVMAVAVVVLTLVLPRACTPDPSPVLNDTRWRDSLRLRELVWEQDSTARMARIHETEARADSLRRVAVAGEGRYRRLARWADSVARVPRTGTALPDTGRLDSVPAYESDSVPRVAYDSLYSAYETADSMNAVLHGAVREYVQAASLYASQAVAATGRYDWAVHTYGARVEALEAALRKQTKGCRVVGLIPCPVVGPSYSVNIGADGKPHAGFGVSVVIPIKLGGK